MSLPLSLRWQKEKNGLLPVIVQDAETGKVLMLGYMNQEALDITLKTDIVTFYSRSKKRLWKKGETSGNTLHFVSAYADCDGDALLIQAVPAGPTCHTGSRSCFPADELPGETLTMLVRTIEQRASADAGISYTKSLLDGGIEAYGAKVLEEAEEVVRAARDEGKQRTIEEAADVLYHLLVLLQGQQVHIADVTYELRKRRKRPSSR